MADLRIGSLCSGYSGLDMAVTGTLGAAVAWLGNGVMPQQAALALHLLGARDLVAAVAETLR